MNGIETTDWIGVISVLLLTFCFYFTLTFIEELKKGDERIIKQSKISAIICLGLALIIPIVYNLVF